MLDTPADRRLTAFAALFLWSALFILAFGALGCDESEDTADERAASKTKKLRQQSQKEVGFPEITRFTEKRMFKRILEKRDEAFSTYTYVLDERGTPHFLCESIGYGLPAATQFTNPKRSAVLRYPGGVSDELGKLPQPDPNGLFMPTSASATYVLCGDSAGSVEAQYVESEIMVLTRRLGDANESHALQ